MIAWRETAILRATVDGAVWIGHLRRRAVVDSLKLPYPNAMGSPDIALKFGDIVSVPTLFVFDRNGKTVRVFYGAPPDLHEQVEGAIAVALK